MHSANNYYKCVCTVILLIFVATGAMELETPAKAENLFTGNAEGNEGEKVSPIININTPENGLNGTEGEFEKQQGSQPENVWVCVPNGRSCELFMQRRLCCSGNPCKPVPNQILQLVTMGGWGVCH